MKNLFVFTLLFGSQALARPYVRLQCYPTDPCLHMQSMSNRCVSSFEIVGSANGSGTEVIQLRAERLGANMVFYPRQEEIQIRSFADGLRFVDTTGDQWGLLKSKLGGQYEGRIVLDQDFEFEVTCQDSSVGLE